MFPAYCWSIQAKEMCILMYPVLSIYETNTPIRILDEGGDDNDEDDDDDDYDNNTVLSASRCALRLRYNTGSGLYRRS
jgi:hypothetical protein